MADRGDEREEGRFTTVVGVNATLVIDAATTLPLAAVRSALAGADPAAGLVGQLPLADPSSLPAFAYLGREPIGVRVLVRGALRVLVSGQQDREVSGFGLSTWHESVHVGAREAAVVDVGGAVVAMVSLEALEVLGDVSAVVAPDDAEVLAEEPEVSEEAEVDVEARPLEPDPSLEPEPERKPAPEPESPPTAVVPVIAEDTIFAGLDEPPAPSATAVFEEIPRFDDPVPASPPPAPLGGPDEVDLSHLFETRHVGAEAAAVRDPGGVISGVPGVPGPSPAAADKDGESGDHDGHTLGPQVLAQMRDDRIAGQPAASGGAINGPSVQAVRCPSGHLNPPHADACRTCRVLIVDRSVQVVPRPSIGHLDFSSGPVVDIDRPLIVGRKPTAEGHSGEPPGLVALPDPEGSLSRAHLEVRLEGWEVLVVDLGSLNGTMVELPGQDPVQLHALEPFLITDGTAMTLAGMVTCVYRAGGR